MREQLIKEMTRTYPDEAWAKTLVEGLISNELHLFMQVSHQTVIAKELIDKELTTNVWLDTLVEQGPFNDYMFPKYYQYLNQRDTFDKLVSECLVKNGYKIVKIGCGNFLTNSQRYR